MIVQPYLPFEGRCDEALAFYTSALGAEVTMIVRFKDHPQPQPAGMLKPGTEDKVMHAQFRIGDSVLMASDGRCSGQSTFSGIHLSLTASDKAEAEKLFNALADGGSITMPFGPTFFSPGFGVVADRFGVTWMVMTQP